MLHKNSNSTVGTTQLFSKNNTLSLALFSFWNHNPTQACGPFFFGCINRSTNALWGKFSRLFQQCNVHPCPFPWSLMKLLIDHKWYYYNTVFFANYCWFFSLLYTETTLVVILVLKPIMCLPFCLLLPFLLLYCLLLDSYKYSMSACSINSSCLRGFWHLILTDLYADNYML